MLMQTFKTARALHIASWERENLITVLRMLETGEIPKRHFDMGVQGKGCGTPACIGGWCARLQDIDETSYVDSYARNRFGDHPLYELYWSQTASETSIEQAAAALRNFLTTGDPQWDEVLA